MNFREQRDKIKELLLESGLKEVNNSKTKLPDNLPAGIVGLIQRKGDIKVQTGYVNMNYGFEIYIVVEDSETADDELLAFIDTVDDKFQEELYVDVDNVEIYDSILNAGGVKIGKFEVILCE